ncbi:hypothetical protein BO78DRAFT_392378 [Aspergillus sclerotiicarbonarius CBS 121057]|uniref:Ubiquitin-like protein smt3 n=1 Tax=Aspergillus sclerotiicarbonarius (strain CBS 121057 / IBT 28362) TaxID=1448318 RepID=A0A319EWP9_ASPSB|nr:hypothetical protein BO78DRAFT_392378 [Aspergillus sclerotiicarbonarius CBS 121057]
MSLPTVSATTTATSELQSSLRELSLTNKSPIKDIPRPTPPTSAPHHHHQQPKPKKKKDPTPIADSWEDEVDSTASSATGSATASPSIRYAEGPLDPPPTPISPQTTASQQSWPTYGNAASAPRSRSPASRRPEKQTAVAGRMIAGALGIRAPKRTEEQRAYDRAVKEQEIRRRNREKEEAEKVRQEEEKAKMAVWDM